MAEELSTTLEKEGIDNPMLVISVELSHRMSVIFKFEMVRDKVLNRVTDYSYVLTNYIDGGTFYVRCGKDFNVLEDTLLLPNAESAEKKQMVVVEFKSDESRKAMLFALYRTLSKWSYTYDYTKKSSSGNVKLVGNYWIVK